ncbi:MAG: cytochrome P450 [Pseudonocardiaceae bacterium]|nr:cytochrome P450 [Pseudonocardiaceae bacterium]
MDRSSAVTASEPTATALPPGPGLPMPVQSALFLLARDRYLPWCRRRYGNVFTVRMMGRAPMVVLSDAEHMKRVFSGPANVFHAGEGNEFLRPLLGENSLLTMDEDAHRRARRMLMPAFNGAALRRYAETVATIAGEQVPRWPTGRITALHPWLQALTLEVILQVVFGVTDERRLDRMRPLVRKVTDIGPVTFFSALMPRLRAYPPARAVWQAAEELDRLLYAEIAERRAAADLEQRADVLSMMLRAGEGADGLSDQELRDELITLVLAGHETTATGLAWTFHELARNPRVRELAAEAAERGDDDYLEAVFKEALRMRPVVYAVARKLTEDTDVAGYRIPAGSIVSPSIGLPHRDARRFDRPEVFDPDRFASGQPSSTDWLPFGGGIRRCIGAGFSIMEAVAILRTALRELDFRPDRRRVEPAKGRGVVLVPLRGARLQLRRRYNAASRSRNVSSPIEPSSSA